MITAVDGVYEVKSRQCDVVSCGGKGKEELFEKEVYMSRHDRRCSIAPHDATSEIVEL